MPRIAAATQPRALPLVRAQQRSLLPRRARHRTRRLAVLDVALQGAARLARGDAQGNRLLVILSEAKDLRMRSSRSFAVSAAQDDVFLGFSLRVQTAADVEHRAGDIRGP